MKVSAVVPTLGRSPLLAEALKALRRDAAQAEDAQGAPIELQIVVVHQGEDDLGLPAGLADIVVRPGCNLGFAGGTNLGIDASDGDLIATVNDDLIVEPGWLAALTRALWESASTAAVQGVNLVLDKPELVDGCGLAWNVWWQAVQLGHGGSAPRPGAPREVFGVSATAALFRRDALAQVALGGGDVFDPRLDSYYEDVELAGRLRAGGWGARVVTTARARHAGSLTGRSSSRRRWTLIYGNRYLAAARLLGSGFWPRIPWMALRDLLDLLRAALSLDLARVAGIPAGWSRAFRHLPSFVRTGPRIG
jgi:N-acetylglucosaminyl-diphospho-decaprenol L-rhamnosyltransferase